MKNLMSFEGNKVEILLMNDEPYFEVYSTGMALGQVKEVKGKKYPRKERIDENIRNAGISTIVRNGQRFINEQQLYDLMLETRTDKCRSFRKWITDEVLPSIRKTGSYSIKQPEQMKLSETTYEYKPKYYKGQIVVMFADLEYFTKINAHNFYYYFHRYVDQFTQGVDYWNLFGAELARFKKDNSLHKLWKGLIALTESGFIKLARFMQGVPKELDCFKVSGPIPERKEEPVNDMHKMLSALRKELVSLEVALGKLDRYNTPKEQKIFLSYVDILGNSIRQKTTIISRFPLSKIKDDLNIVNMMCVPEKDRMEFLRCLLPPKDIENHKYAGTMLSEENMDTIYMLP